MQCLTEERDRATIFWRKDGLTLASTNRISVNQQTLQIFNIQREDYGVYQCFVSRGNMEVQATAQLRLGGTERHNAFICRKTLLKLLKWLILVDKMLFIGTLKGLFLSVIDITSLLSQMKHERLKNQNNMPLNALIISPFTMPSHLVKNY